MFHGPNISGVGARLDTVFAALFENAKVTKIITNNAKDCAVWAAFEIVIFR